MKVVAFITERSEIRAILNHVGVPSEPTEVRQARGLPSSEMWPDNDANSTATHNLHDLIDQDQSLHW